MKFLRNILMTGLFNSMIDEHVDKRIRRFLLFLVTFLFVLLIVGCIMLIPSYQMITWKRLMIGFSIFFSLVLAWIYIRLGFHIVQVRKREKKEAAEREKKIQEELAKEEELYPDHIYKT